jgi:hypothetical protein
MYGASTDSYDIGHPLLEVFDHRAASVLGTEIAKRSLAEIFAHGPQYSSASMIVITRSVTVGSDGSGEW